MDGVAFHDHNAANGRHTECLQIGGSNGLTIRRSTFRNCASTASIHITRYDSAYPSRDVVIENNFFYGNTGASSEPGGNIQYSRGEPGLIIRYNTFVGSGGYSLVAFFYDRPPASPSAQIYGNLANAAWSLPARQLRYVRLQSRVPTTTSGAAPHVPALT